MKTFPWAVYVLGFASGAMIMQTASNLVAAVKRFRAIRRELRRLEQRCEHEQRLADAKVDEILRLREESLRLQARKWLN